MLVPASLFFPPEDRWGLTVSMIIFHVGIAAIMSLNVGAAFITTFAAYVVGFSCRATIWSDEWWLAAAIGIGPSFLCGMCQTLLPEQWPISAISLFMFNGHQAKALAENFMIGDKRVVVCAADIVQDKTDVLGASLGSGSLNVKKESGNRNAGKDDSSANDFVVHDTVMRVIGFTLLVNTELAEALPQSKNGKMNMVSFLTTLEKYLVSSHRLLEGATGKVLTRAFFVRIDPVTQTVVEVLERAKS